MIGISSSFKRRAISTDLQAKNVCPTSNDSLSYRVSAHGRTFNLFSQQGSSSSNTINNVVGANVWTPPLVDQLIGDEKHHQNFEHGTESVASSTREEIMSESTGRSESSTPVQRQNNCHNTNVVSPVSVNTFWYVLIILIVPTQSFSALCDTNFDSPSTLQVHYNAEHISFRDGNNFRCPRHGCGKIFPNKTSLGNHITTHFPGGGATPTIDNPAVLVFQPEVDSTNITKVNANTRNSIQLVPNHSPGVPEPTHTESSDSSNVGKQKVTTNIRTRLNI